MVCNHCKDKSNSSGCKCR